HAFLGQHALVQQELGILPGVNVVGHHGQIVAAGQFPAQAVNQRRLAAAHRTGHADPQGSLTLFIEHEWLSFRTIGRPRNTGTWLFVAPRLLNPATAFPLTPQRARRARRSAWAPLRPLCSLW